MDDVPAYLMYVSLFLNSRVVHAVDDMRYVCIRIFRSDPVIVLTNAIAAGIQCEIVVAKIVVEELNALTRR